MSKDKKKKKEYMRVYVAGPYSADNTMQVLENMRQGINACVTLFECGISPFCPWIDYQFALMKKSPGQFKPEQFYEYSLAWLEVSDMMVLLPGWEKSKGCRREVAFAKKHKIPVLTLDKGEWDNT